MDGNVSDPIVIKIDAHIEDARRKFAQLEKEAERSAAKIQRSFLTISAQAGQGSAHGGADGRSFAGVPTRPDPGDKIEITATRLSGEKVDAFIQKLLGQILSLVGTGALFVPVPGARPVGAGMIAAGGGLQIGASLAERTDEQITRVFTLNEALETFRQNQAEFLSAAEKAEGGSVGGNRKIKDRSELLKKQNDALGENRAIVSGMVNAWGDLGLIVAEARRKNGGLISDFAPDREALRNLQAMEQALRDIASTANDPATLEFLRRFLAPVGPTPDVAKFLSQQDRLPRTGPSTPAFDDLGQPLTDDRINPFPQKSNSLDLGGGASPRRVQLAGLGTSDADGPGGGSLFAGLGLDSGAESLAGFAERLAELPGAFVETREQAGDFGTEIDALAERLIGTNLLFGEQSELLGQLTAQAPELGGELAALFEAGAEEGRAFAEVTDALGASLLDAFEGAIQRGESLSDVFKGLALDMAEIALKAAGNALLDGLFGGGDTGEGLRPDRTGFDGSRGGGQFTRASFTGDSPLGGAGVDGLDRGLADAVAERKALLDIEKMANDEFLVELQRLFGESTSRTQEFLTAFAELSDCLRQLCARIDELAPAPSGAAGAGGGRPDGIGLDGSQPGALSGGAGDDVLFGGAGGDNLSGGAGLRELQRQTIDARGPLDDLATGFVELTQAAGGFETQGGSLTELLGRTNLLFGEQSGLLGQLTAQAPVLGGELAALFEAGSREGRVFAEVTDALGASLLDAFEGAIQRGESLSDVLKGLALDMADIALKAAGNAFLESILGSLLGGVGGAVSGGGGLGPGISPTGGDIFGTPFAKGAAFAPDSAMARNIKAFARGGIVDTPEAFAFADGLGVMGEAGPEAILPLARARSGELGVRAMTGRLPAAPEPAGPTFNIYAPGADREGFREIMSLIVRLDGKIDRVARSMPAVAIRAWSEHRRRGGFR